MILVGLQLVSLAQLLDREFQVAAVQTGNALCVVFVGRAGRRRRTAGSLLAKTQVDPRAFGHIADFAVDQLSEDLRSLIEVLLLEGPHRRFEIPDSGLVLEVEALYLDRKSVV